jgi:hypothetical protein
MRDIHNALRVLTAIAPQAIGTSGIAGGKLSAAIDTKGYDALEFVINHGTAGATGDTTSVVVYECDTVSGSYTSVSNDDLLGTEASAGLPIGAGGRTSGSTQNVSTKIGYKGRKRFVKIRLYGTGHATGIVSATAVLSKASREPTA